MKRAVVFAFVVVVVVAAGVQAQEAQVFYLTFNPTTFEREYQLLQPDTFPQNVPAKAKTVLQGRATWNITYQDQADGLGVGFGHATLGAERRATAQAVMTYLDGILNESGTVDVNFDSSLTTGTGFLAAAGPSGHCTDGCQGGFVFEHITTGTDPGSGPDMNITVNFGYTWNSDGDAPTGTEYDLYSVLLHEMGHGIGLTSFTTSDGSSFTEVLCGGGETVYSFFDDFTYRTAGSVDLWSCTPSFNGSAGDLTSNDVDWRGTNAVASYGGNVPIFAPSPWDDGSSLAHWTSAAGTGNSLMQPSIGMGVQRQLLPWEIQALVDIGYDGAVPVELMSLSVE